MHRTHIRALLLMFLLSCTISLVALCALAAGATANSPTLHQYWSVFCFTFLFAWWFIYFLSPAFRIWTLRLFLDNKSAFRQEKKDEGREGVNGANGQSSTRGAIVTKAAFTVGSQGILIAIVALFLTLVVESEPQEAYQSLLRYCVLLVALATVLLMVFAIDILDTVSNVFAPGQKQPHEYRTWFYRRVGPFLPKGGISYAYYGYAFFSIFLVMALAYFSASLAGIGVAIYAYLGYPYLFGYRGKHQAGTVVQVEVDEKASWVSALLAAFFLIMVMTLGLLPEGIANELTEFFSKLNPL